MKRKNWTLLLMCSLLLGLVAVGLLSWYWYISSQSQNQALTGKLSDRATEFVQKDSSQGTGLWSEVDVVNTSNDDSSEVGTLAQTPCFSVVLPMKTINHQFRQEQDRCVFQARSISPPGYLVLSQYNSNQPTEDSGVLLRRNDATYHEELLKTPNFDQVILFTSAESATAFAWKDQTMFTVALTNSILNTDEIPAIFTSLIKSYQFNSEGASASAEVAPAVEP